MFAMKLRIDSSGRVVLPKLLRKRLGLDHESELEAVEQADGVLLRPLAQQPSMLRVGELWVHQGVPEADINWQRTLDDVREERVRDILEPS